MAIVALAALATAMFARRYDEVRSLVDLELGGLRPHIPAPEHPYATLFQATLADFRVMPRDELWTWAIACLGPLDEARRDDDRPWEWLITAEVAEAAKLMNGTGRQ